MLGNKIMLRWLGPVAVGAVLVAALLTGKALLSAPPTLLIEVSPSLLPADGFSTARVVLQATNGQALPLSELKIEIVEGARRAQVESVGSSRNAVQTLVRAGILPGPVVLEARSQPRLRRGKGFATARVRLETFLDPADRAHDGTPDFLRLDNEADQQAFRRWFTFLAEAQFYRSPGQLPVEINDCAALVRFAYREALREHDGAWASELDLDALPGVPTVQKYQFPFTPLGAGLFRVKPGSFRPEDIRNGSFAQFADAQTLRRRNTHPVSRDIRRAQPGDLLFFRQLEQDLPFHAMIFLGKSQFEPGSQNWIIYHTGPSGGGKGEIRRVTVEKLLEHPSPRWRPLLGNPNFLGVYRWNILRGTE